jgi:hypothetical protein
VEQHHHIQSNYDGEQRKKNTAAALTQEKAVFYARRENNLLGCEHFLCECISYRLASLNCVTCVYIIESSFDINRKIGSEQKTAPIERECERARIQKTHAVVYAPCLACSWLASILHGVFIKASNKTSCE